MGVAAAPLIFLVFFGFSKPAFFSTITLEWLAQMLRHFAFVVRSLSGFAYSSPYLNVLWKEEREIVECSLKIFRKRKTNFAGLSSNENMLQRRCYIPSQTQVLFEGNGT